MSANTIVNRPLFRLLVPLFVGVAAYFLILLGFDSISRLKENFFGVEVVLCVILSAALMELLRIGLHVIYKRIDNRNYLIGYVVGVEVFAAAGLSLILISAMVSIYYHYLVGFSSFATELIVFNAIYLFVSVAYSTFYVSTVYLSKTNLLAISRETEHQRSVEKELSTYKSLINPSFLYANLERIVVLLHGNSQEAASATQTLSEVYRHVLTARPNSLVSVSSEVEQLIVLAQLLNGASVPRVNVELTGVSNLLPTICMVPSTLHAIVLYLVSQFITEPAQPLRINIFVQDYLLVVEATGVRRLVPLDFSRDDFDVINRAYRYFANQPINVLSEGGSTRILVKLIAVEEQ
ncbi:MAG: histidine kinase [Bacteroidales bacterium]|nr:histidine kinase [Bacteroidales bacterium]MBN2748118.1 histidine kinase [Bacteroidales bacterium]